MHNLENVTRVLKRFVHLHHTYWAPIAAPITSRALSEVDVPFVLFWLTLSVLRNAHISPFCVRAVARNRSTFFLSALLERLYTPVCTPLDLTIRPIHHVRCSRGTPPKTPPTKMRAMVGHTSAPSRRSSPMTARRVMAEPRITWERRGWTSRTARWPTSDIMALRRMA